VIRYDLLNAEAEKHPYPLLFATVSGAHLYGFPSPDSDYDLRGVHVLPLRELVSMKPKQETVMVEGMRGDIEMDLVTHDALKFFKMVLKRNGYVLEQLYSPLVVRTTPWHEELKEIAKRAITKRHAHHYLGFAKTQWELFAGEEQPRVKPLLYVYRVLLTGMHLMRTGVVEANLVTLNEEFRLPYIAELVERKVTGTEKGKLDAPEIEFHHGEYLRLVRQLEEEGEKSGLRELPEGQEELDELLVRVRLS
jgi:uncharacterized protein